MAAGAGGEAWAAAPGEGGGGMLGAAAGAGAREGMAAYLLARLERAPANPLYPVLLVVLLRYVLARPMLRAMSRLVGRIMRTAVEANVGKVELAVCDVWSGTLELRGLSVWKGVLAAAPDTLPFVTTDACAGSVRVSIRRATLWSPVPEVSVEAAQVDLTLRRRMRPPRRAADELQRRTEEQLSSWREEQLRAIDLLLWRWLPPESIATVATRQLLHVFLHWAARNVVLRVEGLTVTYELGGEHGDGDEIPQEEPHLQQRQREHSERQQRRTVSNAPKAIRLKLASAGVVPQAVTGHALGTSSAAQSAGMAATSIFVKGVNLEVDSAARLDRAGKPATSVIIKRWSMSADVLLRVPSTPLLLMRAAVDNVLRKVGDSTEHNATASSRWLGGSMAPSVTIDVTVSALLLSVDQPSILGLRALLGDLRMYSTALTLQASRPVQRPVADPREWWRHAVATIVRQRWHLASKAGVVPFRRVFSSGKKTRSTLTPYRLRQRYGELYRRVTWAQQTWLGKFFALSRAERAELEFLERHLGVLDIARFRWWATVKGARAGGDAWQLVELFHKVTSVAQRTFSPLVPVGSPGIRVSVRVACAKVAAMAHAEVPTDLSAGTKALDIAQLEIRLLRASVDLHSSGELHVVTRLGTLLCYDCAEKDERLTTVLASPAEHGGEDGVDSTFKGFPAHRQDGAWALDDEEFWGASGRHQPFLETRLTLPGIMASLGETAAASDGSEHVAKRTILGVSLASVNVTYSPGLATRFAMLLPRRMWRARAHGDAVSEAATSALASDIAFAMVQSRPTMRAVLEMQARGNGMARSISVDVGHVRVILACPESDDQDGTVQTQQGSYTSPPSTKSERFCVVFTVPSTRLRSGSTLAWQARSHTLRGPQRAELLRSVHGLNQTMRETRMYRRAMSAGSRAPNIALSALDRVRRAIHFGGESIGQTIGRQKGANVAITGQEGERTSAGAPSEMSNLPRRKASANGTAKRADDTVTIDEIELGVEIEVNAVPFHRAFLPRASLAGMSLVAPVKLLARVVSGRNVSTTFTRALRVDGRCSPLHAVVSPFTAGLAARLAHATLADASSALETMRTMQEAKAAIASMRADGPTDSGSSTFSSSGAVSGSVGGFAANVTVRIMLQETSASLFDSSSAGPVCRFVMKTVHATFDADQGEMDANVFFGGLAIEDLTSHGRAAARKEQGGSDAGPRYLLAPLPAPVRLGAFATFRGRGGDAKGNLARAFLRWRRTSTALSALRAMRATSGGNGVKVKNASHIRSTPVVTPPSTSPNGSVDIGLAGMDVSAFLGRQSNAQLHLRLQRKSAERPKITLDMSILRVLLDFDSIIEVANLGRELAAAVADGMPTANDASTEIAMHPACAGPQHGVSWNTSAESAGGSQRGYSTPPPLSGKYAWRSRNTSQTPVEGSRVIFSGAASSVTVTVATRSTRWAMITAQDVEAVVGSGPGVSKIDVTADDVFVVDLLAASHHYRRIIDEFSLENSCALSVTASTRTWNQDSAPEAKSVRGRGRDVLQQTTVRVGLTNIRVHGIMRFFKDCNDTVSDFLKRLRHGDDTDDGSSKTSDTFSDIDAEMDHDAYDNLGASISRLGSGASSERWSAAQTAMAGSNRPESSEDSSNEGDPGVGAGSHENGQVRVMPTLIFVTLEGVRLDFPRNCHAPDMLSFRFDRATALLPAPGISKWALQGHEHTMSFEHLFATFAAADSAERSESGNAPQGIALHTTPIAVYWCNRTSTYPGLWTDEAEANAPYTERLELRTADVQASIDFPLESAVEYAVHVRCDWLQGVIGETQFGVLLGILWENSYETPTFGTQVGYPKPLVEVRENYIDAAAYAESGMGVCADDKCIAHVRIDIQDFGTSLEGVRRQADPGDGSAPRVAAVAMTGATMVVSYFEGKGRLVRLTSDAIDILDQQPNGDERVDFVRGRLNSSRPRCRPLVSAPSSGRAPVGSSAGGALGSSRYRPGGRGEWSGDEAFCLDYVIMEDRTHVMELTVSGSEFMWPYDSDFNLVWQVKDMFTAYLWRPYVFMNPPDSRPIPWMYFNIIVSESRLVLPLFADPHCSLEKRFKFAKEMGIVATFDLLRVGYFFGGDGENPIKLDVRKLELKAYHARRRTQRNAAGAPPLSQSSISSAAVGSKRGLQVSRQASADAPKAKGDGQSTKGVREDRILEPTNLQFSLAWTLPREEAKYLTDIKLELEDANFRVCFGQMHDETNLYARVIALANKLAAEAAQPWVPYYATLPPPPVLPDYEDHSFRSTRSVIKVSIGSVRGILVDDRGHICRDVLSFSVSSVRADVLQESAAHGKDPALFAALRLDASVRYLNSAIEAMESILDTWPVTGEMKTSVKGQTLKLTSSERMNVRMSPEVLRSLGDAIAFTSKLNQVGDAVSQQLHNSHPDAQPAMLSPLHFVFSPPSKKTPPSAGLNARMQDRVMKAAQRSRAKVAESDYIITNYTGRSVRYWVGDSSGPVRPDAQHVVHEGQKQYLRVAPEETLLIPTTEHATMQPRRAKAIIIFVEGSLAAVPNVLVDRVGLYMYEVQIPMEGRTDALPMIVEVSLQGRLKCLTLRSTMAIRNNTDCRMHFRLHRHDAVAAEQQGRRSMRAVVRIPSVGTLGKGEVVHLPITVGAKGGLLYVHPEGFQRADKDVITLDRTSLGDQQGVMCCPSLVEGDADFYCCLELTRRLVPNMAFGAQGSPVEVDILELQPPLVLQNRLPYEADCIVYDRIAGTEHLTTIPAGGERAIYDVNLDHNLRLGTNVIEARAFDLEHAQPPNDLSVSATQVQTDGAGTDPRNQSHPVLEEQVTYHTVKTASINRFSFRWRKKKAFARDELKATDVSTVSEQLGEAILGELEGQDFKTRTLHLAEGSPPSLDDNDNYNHQRPVLLNGAVSETRDGSKSAYKRIVQPSKRPSLRLKVQVSADNRSRARKVVVFAPYWIMNELGMPLLVRDSMHGLAMTCPPGPLGQRSLRARSPRLYCTTRDSVSLAVEYSKWSKMFPIDGLGMKGAVSVLDDKRKAAKTRQATTQSGEIAYSKHELGVEVSIAPGVFHRTKVLRVTPRFILKNMTRREHMRFGMPDADVDTGGVDGSEVVGALGRDDPVVLEVRQRDCPRSLRSLPYDELVPHHWVDRDRRAEIQVRPVHGRWRWSSGFRIDDTRQIALRIRNEDTGRCMILPLAVSTGATVCVVFGGGVTTAPYVIENRCKHVAVRFEQALAASERDRSGRDGSSLKSAAESGGKARESAANEEDVLLPGSRTPFAWDAPSNAHKLRVQFGIFNDGAVDDASEIVTREFQLDKIRMSATVKISTARRPASSAPSQVDGDGSDISREAGAPTARRTNRTSGTSSFVSASKSVSARTAVAKIAKKFISVGDKVLSPRKVEVVVYACIFARGPTRVLLLSEDPGDAAGVTEEEETQDLQERVDVLEAQLAEASAQLSEHQWAGSEAGITDTVTSSGPDTLEHVQTSRMGRTTSASRKTFMSPAAQAIADLTTAPSPLIATRVQVQLSPLRTTNASMLEKVTPSRPSSIAADIIQGSSPSELSRRFDDVAANPRPAGQVDVSRARSVSEHEANKRAMRARRLRAYSANFTRGRHSRGSSGSIDFAAGFGSGNSFALDSRSNGRFESGAHEYSDSDLESDVLSNPRSSISDTLARAAIEAYRARTSLSLSQVGSPLDQMMSGPVGVPQLSRSVTSVRNGNLLVGVLEARGLKGNPDRCHPYVVLECNDDTHRTRAVRKSLHPKWDETVELDAVSSSFTLKVTVYSSDRISADTFLGEVHIHLAETVPVTPRTSANASAAVGRVGDSAIEDVQRIQHWYTLGRRRAKEQVSGEVKLSFEWVSFRGVLDELKLRHRALEADLQLKLELLALFKERTCPSKPLDPQALREVTWHPAARTIDHHKRVEAETTPTQWVTPEAGAGHHSFDDSVSDGGRALADADVPDDSRSAFRMGALEVKVVEARALSAPTGGGGLQDFVRGIGSCDAYARVACAGQVDQTEVVQNTSSPVWDAGKMMRFENVTEKSSLKVRIFHKRTFGSDVLLGEASIPCYTFDENRPEYIWVALSGKASNVGKNNTRRGKMDRGGSVENLPNEPSTPEEQVVAGHTNIRGEVATVRLRVHWRDASDYEAFNLQANVSMAEIALTVIDSAPRELAHVFLERVSLDFASTSKEDTTRICVGFFQVDNQLLNTANPVVLAPTFASQLGDEALLNGEVDGIETLARLRQGKHMRSDNTVVVSFKRTKVGEGNSGESTVARNLQGSGSGSFAEVGSPSRGHAGDAGTSSALAVQGADRPQQFGAGADYLHFQSFDAELAEIDVLLEEDFTNAFMEFVFSLPLGDLSQTATGAARLNSSRDPMADILSVLDGGVHVSLANAGNRVRAVEAGRWYFEKLRLFPIKLNVTLSVTNDVRVDREANFYRFLSASGFSLIDVDNMHLRIAGYEDNNAFMGHEEIRKRIQWHYTIQLLRSLHSVLGKVNFLGTPVALVSSVGTGVYDFFSNPVRGLRTAGRDVTAKDMAKRLGDGVATGTLSLLKNTGFGVFDTVSQMTGATAKGLALLSMDDNYILRFQRRRNTMTVAEHLVFGAQQLGLGLFEGLTGLVTKPITGARTGGARGCLKGMLKGVAGLAVKPTAGALEFAASTADAVTSGIERASKAPERAPKSRIHEPRHAASDLVDGAPGMAQLQQQFEKWDALLHKMRKGKYANDATRDYVHIRDNLAVVITMHRILYVDLRSERRKWCVYLDRVTDVVGLERRLQIIVSFKTVVIAKSWLGCCSEPSKRGNNPVGGGDADEAGEAAEVPPVGQLKPGIPMTMRKIIYCRSRDQYHVMLVKLHRHRVRSGSYAGGSDSAPSGGNDGEAQRATFSHGIDFSPVSGLRDSGAGRAAHSRKPLSIMLSPALPQDAVGAGDESHLE